MHQLAQGDHCPAQRKPESLAQMLNTVTAVQPFYSTERVTDMITSADACMRKLQGNPQPAPADDGRPPAADAPQLFK